MNQRAQFLIKRIILLTSVLFVFAACVQTINNIDQEPFSHVQDGVTIKDVGAAIKRAAAGKGWQVRDTQEGEIEAELFIRKHRAKVRITFDTGNFSIQYVSSRNLKRSGNNIHRNYNHWVTFLRNAIQSQVSAIRTGYSVQNQQKELSARKIALTPKERTNSEVQESNP